MPVSNAATARPTQEVTVITLTPYFTFEGHKRYRKVSCKKQVKR